ncbi:hypothetical protein B0H10DRAFT_1949022 [Mycena sp. CBHHK59/15]|nr:hypothetical protein B0H10DRAFT_1949022 [Mycena sp. CBHHK59/15]
MAAGRGAQQAHGIGRLAEQSCQNQNISFRIVTSGAFPRGPCVVSTRGKQNVGVDSTLEPEEKSATRLEFERDNYKLRGARALVNSNLLAERPLGRVFQTMVEEFAAQLDNSNNPGSTHPSMGVPVDVGFIQEMRAVEQWIDCLTITERLESVDFLLEHGRDPETYFFTCLLHVDGDQRRVEVAAQFLLAQQLAHARILAANHGQEGAKERRKRESAMRLENVA